MKRRRKKKRRFHVGFHESNKLIGKMHYRSGWELSYAKILDGDERVVSYRYEPFSVPYVSNARTMRVRMYYPDFEVNYADGSRVIVEIKPKRRLTSGTVVKKILACRKWAFDNSCIFTVVTEVELRMLGAKL